MRELTSLPAVIRSAPALGLRPEEVLDLVGKITANWDWAQSFETVALASTPLSFLEWLRDDPTRAPQLFTTLVKSGYIDDPDFDPCDRLNWSLFFLRRGITRDAFNLGWRRWVAETRRWGLVLYRVN